MTEEMHIKSFVPLATRKISVCTRTNMMHSIRVTTLQTILLTWCKLDVRGSVHHNIIHKENPTRCNNVSKFYFICIWNSACFGRHTLHHQEPKTALATSGFTYVEGCWKSNVQQPSTYAKPESASAVLGSWWYAVCRPKHVKLYIYMKWHFVTLLILVGFSLRIILQTVIQHCKSHLVFLEAKTSYALSINLKGPIHSKLNCAV
jgi:hypothetical protein